MFARIEKPLTELMKKDAPFLWSPAFKEAFNGLRSTLASAVMRHHLDQSLHTTVTADAADGCLRQAMHQVLRATGPLHVPYKHLSHVPAPVTLDSRLVHILLFTSLNLDYLTFPLFSCIFLFLSCTKHEPLTKLL